MTSNLIMIKCSIIFCFYHLAQKSFQLKILDKNLSIPVARNPLFASFCIVVLTMAALCSLYFTPRVKTCQISSWAPINWW